MDRILRKLFFGALTIKIITGFLKLFLPYDQPHRWRQIDTLSISMRYWMRWTIETDLRAALLPAALRSGDTYGIMGMEFPILNILCAPFFFFGTQTGSFLANLFLMVLNLGLTFWCSRIWKGVYVHKVAMSYVCLSLALVTLSAQYIFRFMPDYTSFMLVFIAISLAWNRNSYGFAFILASIGLLMKPTSIICFAFCFLHPKWKSMLKKNILWISSAVFITLMYYTLGMKYIASYQDGPSLFATQFRNPIQEFISFFSEPKQLFTLLFRKLLFAPGIFCSLFAYPFLSKQSRTLLITILLLFLCQFLAIVGLDGAHSYVHEYYYIASAPLLIFLCFTLYRGIQESSHRWKSYFLRLGVLLCLVSFLESSQFELRHYLPKTSKQYVRIRDCQTLKDRHPEIPWNNGYVFRSGNAEAFPQAGICFFEREGSLVNEYGLFSTNDPIPENCEKLDQEGFALIVKCH